MTLEMRLPDESRRARMWTRITLIFAPSTGRRRQNDRADRLQVAYDQQHVALKHVIAERNQLQQDKVTLTNRLEDALKAHMSLQEQLREAIAANEVNLRRTRMEATMAAREDAPSEWPTQPIRRVQGVLTPTAIRAGSERTYPEIDVTEVLEAGRHAAERLHVHSAAYAESADLGNPAHLANATPYRS
jgi:gas vesicle protein